MAPEKKADRRVSYTKLALREALVRLMRSKHISATTVKSICELADINRSTFYLHYRDQFDLLHQIEQEVLATLGERLLLKQDASDETSPHWPITLEVMTEILEYARENADLARVLLSENCDFAFQQDILELADEVMVAPDDSLSQREKDYIVTYRIGGCIALAEKWLKGGLVEEPGEIAALMLQLLYFGTGSFVKG